MTDEQKTFGQRYLDAYRATFKSVSWDYATIQKIKELDRDGMVAMFTGQVDYAVLQMLKEREPEELMASLAASQEEGAAVMIAMLGTLAFI